MPEAFDKCAAQKGSRIRTIRLKGNKYMHVCIDKDGNTHNGYVKTKKEDSDD